MNTKVICCFHRNSSKNLDPILFQYPDVFVPLLGGAAYCNDVTDDFFKGMARDDERENISDMNHLCSEGTHLFWLRKNLDRLGNPDMIGLCHYRRVFDLDYNNLDLNTVYVKRCDCPIPNHHDILGNCWADPVIADLIRDLYFNRFPQYYYLYKDLQKDYTFFDKEMFVMNRQMFYNYADYMMTCLRILLENVYPIVLKWYMEKPSAGAYQICFHRGFSYHIEFFAALYFAMLKERGYRLQVTRLTKGSEHDTYSNMCVPRGS